MILNGHIIEVRSSNIYTDGRQRVTVRVDKGSDFTVPWDEVSLDDEVTLTLSVAAPRAMDPIAGFDPDICGAQGETP